jgi:hypothetical protein
VDYFSRFPEVITLTETSSSKVISSLKSMFSRYGVPETLLSDNGPQFASHEFDEFANAYEFTHITSSPHYPQSNGLAEQTVKTVKKLLKCSEDPYMGLLNYWSTPLPWCGKSPGELLMGRSLCNNLPQTSENLIPKWKHLSDFQQCEKEFKKKQKRNYDTRHRVIPGIGLKHNLYFLEAPKFG